MQILPNGKSQFIDSAGQPLSSGSVGFYFPGTLNPKPTYQDSAGTIANPNPVPLDSRGQAIIWGSGVYRQILKDASGVTIWDQLTEDANSGLTGNITNARWIAGGSYTDPVGSTPGTFVQGTTTTFNLPVPPGSISNISPFFDGTFQQDDQISSLNGSTLVFASAVPAGIQAVEVKIGTTIAIGTPGSGTVSDVSVAPGTKLYNRIHDIFDLRDYGGINDGVTDNTSAFNNAIAAASSVNGSLYIPAGNWAFNSKPNDIVSRVKIYGDGLNSTVLLRNYNEAVPTTGFLNFVGVSGVTVSGIGMDATSTSSGGCLIAGKSTASIAGSITLEDLWLSELGSNNLSGIILLDGSAKSTGAIGFRDSAFRNVHAFGVDTTNAFSVSLKDIEGFSWYGGGLYPAGGTGAGAGQLQITGAIGSNNIDINFTTCAGIALDHVTDLMLRCPAIAGNISNASTALNCRIEGSVSGSVQTNWTASVFIPLLPTTLTVFANGSVWKDNMTGRIVQSFTVTGIGTAFSGVNFLQNFPNAVESVSATVLNSSSSTASASIGSAALTGVSLAASFSGATVSITAIGR